MLKYPSVAASAFGALMSLVPLVSQPAEAAERDVEAVAALRSQLALSWGNKSTGARPDGGSGPIGMNYGAVQAEYLNAGPSVRIWFVREGEHAVLPTDDDLNGIPDFVEELASISEEVAARFVAANWRSPLSDSDRGLPNNGGDSRFDVYLLNFGSGSDGVFVKEFCEGSGPARCGGYMAIENDFVGFNYPSVSDALRTLFSHEYAHAISAAYTDELPTWFSEGVATWAESEFADVEADVIRLASRWFRSPGVSLDDSTNPGSGWPYASSAFFIDLSQRFGRRFLRTVHERLADGSSRSAAGALSAELEAQGSTLREAWISFTARSWFTGSRARSTADVWSASRMPEIGATLFELADSNMRFEQGTWSMSAWTVAFDDENVEWTACSEREGADLVVIASDGQSFPVLEGDVFALSAGDVLIVSGRPRLSLGLCSELKVSDSLPCESTDGCAPPCSEGDAGCSPDCEEGEACTPSTPVDEDASSSCASAGGSLGLWAAVLFAFGLVGRGRRSRLRASVDAA